MSKRPAPLIAFGLLLIAFLAIMSVFLFWWPLVSYAYHYWLG